MSLWIDPPRRTAPDGSSFQLQHWTHEFHYALVSDPGDWRDAFDRLRFLFRFDLAFNGWFGWTRRRSRSRTGGCTRTRARAIADDSYDRVDLYSFAFLHKDVLNDAGGRRGNFCIDLIGRNLKQRLVALDAVAFLFEPLCERTFKNAFAHLGHDDLGFRHWFPS